MAKEQKFYKALQDVYGFIEGERLTGEKTQELVKIVKGAPWRTIEEAYKELYNIKQVKKENKVRKSQFGRLILEGKVIRKILIKISLRDLSKNQQKTLKESQLDIQAAISNFLDDLK